ERAFLSPVRLPLPPERQPDSFLNRRTISLIEDERGRYEKQLEQTPIPQPRDPGVDRVRGIDNDSCPWGRYRVLAYQRKSNTRQQQPTCSHGRRQLVWV